MKKNIIIIFCIILTLSILRWLALNDYLGASADYLISFFPGDWKKKAIEYSNWSRFYLPIGVILIIGLKWILFVYFKIKEKNDNKISSKEI